MEYLSSKQTFPVCIKNGPVILHFIDQINYISTRQHVIKIALLVYKIQEWLVSVPGTIHTCE